MVLGSAVSPFFEDAGDHFGIEFYFFLIDSLLQSGGVVIRQEGDGGLLDHRAGVYAGVDPVNRAAADRVAGVDGHLAGGSTGVFGKQGGVNIDDLPLKLFQDRTADDAHESCQSDQVDAGRLQFVGDFLTRGLAEAAGAIRTGLDMQSRHTGLLGKLQNAAVRDIRYDESHLGRERAGLDRFDNGAAVAPGPRSEDRDAGQGAVCFAFGESR